MWGAEAVIDSTVQTFFALVLAWTLYRDDGKSWVLLLSLLPVFMDLDHLLPTYSQGIKAFHSMFFVYIISGTFLGYGYLRGSDRAKKLGIVSFTILIFSLSMDLLEGGRIAFLYPLSNQAYALPYFGVNEGSKIGVAVFMMFLLLTVYAYERSLGRETHREKHISWTDIMDRISYGVGRSLHSYSIGSETSFRLTALLASFLVLYASVIILISR